MRSSAALLLSAVAFSGAVLADQAPIGPEDPTWAMRAQLGYSKSGGNTDNSAGNFLFHVAHVLGEWKVLFSAGGLYGSSRGETTAQAWDAHLQANYNITPKLYWYAGLRYDDDRFSGLPPRKPSRPASATSF